MSLRSDDEIRADLAADARYPTYGHAAARRRLSLDAAEIPSLRARVAELEAENARLRAEVANLYEFGIDLAVHEKVTKQRDEAERLLHIIRYLGLPPNVDVSALMASIEEFRNAPPCAWTEPEAVPPVAPKPEEMFCSECNQRVTRWEFDAVTGLTIEPCGHSGPLIALAVAEPVVGESVAPKPAADAESASDEPHYRHISSLPPQRPGEWLHVEDGSHCPETMPNCPLFPRGDTGRRWWCTTHQMHLVHSSSKIQER
jgi:hypothetical protein